jgi:DNA-binding NtrC family response regulator
MNINVSILDDDAQLLKVVLEVVRTHFPSFGTTDVNEYIETAKGHPGVLVVDWNLSYGINGMSVIKKILPFNSLCHPIFMSAQTSTEMLLEIIDEGWGSFYVPKDGMKWLDDLIVKIERAKELLNRKMEAANKELQRLKKLDEKLTGTLKLLEE